MLINDEEDHLAKVMLMLEDKNSGTETKSLFLREFNCILYGYPIYKKHEKHKFYHRLQDKEDIIMHK